MRSGSSDTNMLTTIAVLAIDDIRAPAYTGATLFWDKTVVPIANDHQRWECIMAKQWTYSDLERAWTARGLDRRRLLKLVGAGAAMTAMTELAMACLLYTSDAADDLTRV